MHQRALWAAHSPRRSRWRTETVPLVGQESPQLVVRRARVCWMAPVKP
jgi:hypothetical protein